MQPNYLSTAYLPPIQYITKLFDGDIFIERHEHYIKQSYRNRCNILAANGVIPLTIPIVKRHNEKMPIGEVEIDYELPWQKIHFKSIESAYKNSPYFDYYIDEFMPFFEERHQLLLDYNTQLLQVILSIIGIKPNIHYTDEFEKAYPCNDFRYNISPKSKIADESFASNEYYQVFGSKFGFAPNLSIIDLIFNEGPSAKEILMQCIKKAEM